MRHLSVYSFVVEIMELMLRTTSHILTVVLITVSAYGQQSPSDTYQCINWRKSNIELRMGISGIACQAYSNLKPGIFSDFVIDNRFLLGAFTQNTVGNFAYKMPGYQNNVMTKEIGISFGVSGNSNKIIYMGSKLRIGYIRLVADSTKEIKLLKPYTKTAVDNGISILPELYVTINLTRSFHLHWGMGYNMLMVSNETVVKERAIDTWYINGALSSTIWRKKTK